MQKLIFILSSHESQNVEWKLQFITILWAVVVVMSGSL